MIIITLSVIKASKEIKKTDSEDEKMTEISLKIYEF
jgi:hypothetical protein